MKIPSSTRVNHNTKTLVKYSHNDLLNYNKKQSNKPLINTQLSYISVTKEKLVTILKTINILDEKHKKRAHSSILNSRREIITIQPFYSISDHDSKSNS